MSAPPHQQSPADRRHEPPATRHAAAVTRLLAIREDLRGVSAWADFVDDSVRWTA